MLEASDPFGDHDIEITFVATPTVFHGEGIVTPISRIEIGIMRGLEFGSTNTAFHSVLLIGKCKT